MNKEIIRVKESTHGPVKFSFYTYRDWRRDSRFPKFVLDIEDLPIQIRGRIMLLKLAKSFTYVEGLGHAGGWPDYEMTLMLFDGELDELLRIALEKRGKPS